MSRRGAEVRRCGACATLTTHANTYFKSPVDLLTSTLSSPSSVATQPTADLEVLEQSIQSVSDMLDRVLTYVRSVLSGEVEGNQAVGRYLMDTLGAGADDLEKSGFNASLQVSICISYAYHELMYVPFPLGYSYGFVPRQSCPLASGSLVPASTCHCRVVGRCGRFLQMLCTILDHRESDQRAH